MIFSYEWLKEFLRDIPEPDVLMEQLTLHSVEVEGVSGGVDIGNVVVAEVVETRKHPDADTLNIGLFNVGEDQPRQIIFGGVALLEKGMRIPVALAPTVLPGGLKIKERQLRGELSQGMCCLNSELGILDGSDTLYEFDANVEPGTPIVDVLPLHEVGIDIDNKSMTHRADLFCHLNMAREIAAVFGLKFTTPKLSALPRRLPPLNVTVEDTDGCPRYMGLRLDVTVGQSPEFIQQRLRACGVKSINNVVDITNYVMLEYGEPMHAFDVRAVAGEQVVVRRARKGETLVTLDHEKKLLDETVLVIADAEKPMAIAGVIGGEDSAVNDSTTSIILEVANFDPFVTRKAAQSVNVRTEGALRWEKGLPSSLALPAAQRAVELLEKYASARLIHMVDVYPSPQAQQPIAVPSFEIDRLAGMAFTKRQVQEYLGRLECVVTTKGSGEKLVYRVTPPWFRTDLHIPQDIIEEIVRLHGVTNIPEQQLQATLHVGEQEETLPWVRFIKNELRSYGLFEVQNYSFYGEELIRRVGLDPAKEHLELHNPLSEDLRYLRVSVLPRMLENAARNQRWSDTFRFFEIGHVYFEDREVQQLGIMVVGGEDTLRRVRGITEQLLEQLHIPTVAEVTTKTGDCEFWGMYNGGASLQYNIGKQHIGSVGEVDPTVLNVMGIDKPIGFAVLSLPIISEHATVGFAVSDISPFPALDLDLSLLIDESVDWKTIEDEVRIEGKDLLQSIDVLDVYRGKKIPAGKKSISFRLVFQSQTGTLEMAALEQWREKFVEKMHKKIGAELRAT